MCSLQPILGDFEPGHGLQTQRPPAWSVHKGVEVRSGWQPFTNPKQTSVQCRFANYVFSCSSFCSYTFCRSDQLPQRDHLRLLTAWPRPRSEGAVGTQPALGSKLIAEAGGWRGTMARTLRWLELCLGQIGHGLPKKRLPHLLQAHPSKMKSCHYQSISILLRYRLYNNDYCNNYI